MKPPLGAAIVVLPGLVAGLEIFFSRARLHQHVSPPESLLKVFLTERLCRDIAIRSGLLRPLRVVKLGAAKLGGQPFF
jgi:hypothetical protein